MAGRLLQKRIQETAKLLFSTRISYRVSFVLRSSAILFASSSIKTTNLNEGHTKLKEPDISTLSHNYLVKNSSSVTVDAVCSLINQTTIALIHTESQYARSIYALIKLLDYQANIKGRTQDEETLWDLIVQQKSTIEEHKQERTDMEAVMACVEKLASAAAETAFSVGADPLAIMLNELLLSAQCQLQIYKDTSLKAEHDLTDAQVRDIQTTDSDTENS